MNEGGSTGGGEVGLRLGCLEGSMEGGNLSAACGQLRGEVGKLRLHVVLQLFNGLFELIVGGDLLRLAGLHGFEVREDDVREQMGEGIQGIVYEEILRMYGEKRTITNGGRLVTGGWI
jgi:hypothetical protein